ncbi:hypothetical protein GCM10011360_17790 [Primorskyibacter flagellatus]|uniref:Uncharacterized protein n=1 Tax=Primorskyibacter flagellatus TaxID=1387277 RepID=A0A917A625_9RHOB|nr:hypothetical protein [Primorskyibacter flagellatus]GGE30174.1 hypothetical protein GCM10011360_17790 [Primorskyibacter flagellatus]
MRLITSFAIVLSGTAAQPQDARPLPETFFSAGEELCGHLIESAKISECMYRQTLSVLILRCDHSFPLRYDLRFKCFDEAIARWRALPKD